MIDKDNAGQTFKKGLRDCNIKGDMDKDNMIDKDNAGQTFKKIKKIIRTIQDRSSRGRCSVRKGVLRNFAKFTGKHLCQSFFFQSFFLFY